MANLQSASNCFDPRTFCLVLLFTSVLLITGLLIRSKIRLNDHPSETLFALTYELTKTGDPAGYLASPAGFITCVLREKSSGTAEPIALVATALRSPLGKSEI
jgi:hypothetical protein